MTIEEIGKLRTRQTASAFVRTGADEDGDDSICLPGIVECQLDVLADIAREENFAHPAMTNRLLHVIATTIVADALDAMMARSENNENTKNAQTLTKSAMQGLTTLLPMISEQIGMGAASTSVPVLPVAMHPDIRGLSDRLWRLGGTHSHIEANEAIEIVKRHHLFNDPTLELVAAAIVDGIYSIGYKIVGQEWVDESNRVKEAATVDRPGWNDYYMTRWMITRDMTCLKSIHDVIGHDDLRGQTAKWMVDSVRQQHPRFDEAWQAMLESLKPVM